jgi:hypothetical protein
VREERHMALGSPVPVRSSRMGSDRPERRHTAGMKDKTGRVKEEDKSGRVKKQDRTSKAW